MPVRFFVCSLLLTCFSGVVYAQIGNPPPGVSTVLPDPLKGATFTTIAQGIITGLRTIAIPVVGIMVLIGGLQIITAGGDPEKFRTGRKTLFYAFIGFAVVLLANAVVLIIQELLQGS